jgi:uncharacterized coiled-coil protein SlyX
MQFNNPTSTKNENKNMTTRHSKKTSSRSPLRLGFLLIPLVLACFGLSPATRAVDPPPDGGYPGANTAEGEDALFSLTTGLRNTAIGFEALFNNTTGSVNTATGFGALQSNSTGNGNTANGVRALFSNTTGILNTATGFEALQSNTTGQGNTANGVGALFSNTTGSVNTATDEQALFSNTTGGQNTAIGDFALLRNTTGSTNTATGLSALFSNTTGIQNTAIGDFVLFSNTTGSTNTAIGVSALGNNTTGNNNTADGSNSLYNNRTGAFNIALGDSAGFNTTGRNNIDIGNQGMADESDTIRIGTVGTHTDVYIAGISGVTVAGGVGVIVDSAGHLGTVVSSARFKHAIKPMDKASEAILGLRPVTFHYTKELDPEGIPQFGLVAEDVAKVNSDLVARDDDGKPYTVRYDAVNAMLLNEFLKEHRTVLEQNRKIQTQDATIAQLKQDFAEQQKQIDALTAGLQKVSAQIEVSGPAPRIVGNNQ